MLGILYATIPPPAPFCQNNLIRGGEGDREGIRYKLDEPLTREGELDRMVGLGHAPPSPLSPGQKGGLRGNEEEGKSEAKIKKKLSGPIPVH